MAHFRLIVPLALSALLLSSCGSYKGTWPRLGPTVSDADAATGPSDGLTVPSLSPQAGVSPETADKLDTITARLAKAAANYQDLEERLTLQMRSVSAAVSKVGDRTGSGWSLAQLELSRMNQIESDLRTVRSEAAGVAADLASFSAKGLEVSAPVAQTGTLINAIDIALADADTVRQKARNRLSS